MKKILLLLSIVLVSIVSKAQTTIANGDMEVWTNVGANTEEPDRFNSIKNGSGNSTAISFAPKCVFRTGSPHGGLIAQKFKH